eukprot:Phypoly_transcript_23146.p1 GENE.Phypoly_transcript_23146~~Phypoly_transcript_23146.p1  ORF type:complete len:109 (+),score=10.53 Phypoly_transcript_23146:75-401(+)
MEITKMNDNQSDNWNDDKTRRAREKTSGREGGFHFYSSSNATFSASALLTQLTSASCALSWRFSMFSYLIYLFVLSFWRTQWDPAGITIEQPEQVQETGTFLLYVFYF